MNNLLRQQQEIPDPAVDLPLSTQSREPKRLANQFENMEVIDNNQQAILPQRRPLPSPSSPTRGRLRGRPRLARNPVGRPRGSRRRRPSSEQQPPREIDELPPQFTGAD
ncbi:hypothetical protein B0T26DRAFT_864009 [Lasiosphaeria miniovina]|uniref:Uncharacterized protein n=1 Tax=Lasiosphaeria miniovina TaxID=1954250 RepID=A0AA40DJ34_9PEZI|nr:uncharacterized protein B0T26DRAFT_864009 [Lasiosphaeria miniovina]KAK0703191.1 hypothetical protein B0T26DRAFT_864009 [Lasiosphaeria miniovina]